MHLFSFLWTVGKLANIFFETHVIKGLVIRMALIWLYAINPYAVSFHGLIESAKIPKMFRYLNIVFSKRLPMIIKKSSRFIYVHSISLYHWKPCVHWHCTKRQDCLKGQIFKFYLASRSDAKWRFWASSSLSSSKSLSMAISSKTRAREKDGDVRQLRDVTILKCFIWHQRSWNIDYEYPLKYIV